MEHGHTGGVEAHTVRHIGGQVVHDHGGREGGGVRHGEGHLGQQVGETGHGAPVHGGSSETQGFQSAVQGEGGRCQDGEKRKGALGDLDLRDEAGGKVGVETELCCDGMLGLSLA